MLKVGKVIVLRGKYWQKLSESTKNDVVIPM